MIDIQARYLAGAHGREATMEDHVPLPDVLILMATYNGGRFLADQLKSIGDQDHANWRLLISDDGSTDGSRTAIADFIRSRPAGQVTLLEGPRQGAVANFRSLLRRAALQGSCLAFSDQDDVWDTDHLSRALSALQRLQAPLAVYGCRMRICDDRLKPTSLSPLPARPLGFRNALVQNVLSGNTMVMTPAAARLLQQAEPEAGPIPVHDWWAYQLVTGAGGTAFLDPEPGIFYRQHESNVVGANRGLSALPARIQRHLRGTHRIWAHQNSAALAASALRLTPENRTILADFTKALEAPWPYRIALLRRSGVHHQRVRARAAFWLSVAMGRF